MYDSLVVEKDQSAENLLCEASNQLEREAAEIVRLDKLVQVDTQKFGGYAKMTTEIEALDKIHDTMATVGILKKRLVRHWAWIVSKGGLSNLPIPSAFARY